MKSLEECWFSANTFSVSAKPYDYMLECGFSQNEPRFSQEELVILSRSIGELDAVHHAFALAIAERFRSIDFLLPAIASLTHSDSSIRIAAYNAIRAMPEAVISKSCKSEINRKLRQIPEAEFLAVLQ